MADLSILIPARNEMFLKQTIDNILENIEADTEIITVMDGYWAEPPIPQHDRVTIVHLNESIGQRAATNMACKLSSAKYVMKVDAHCSFDKGFDRKMIEAISGHDNWTMVPMMKNLHAFDWVCTDGHRRYQGPSGPCQEKLNDGKSWFQMREHLCGNVSGMRTRLVAGNRLNAEHYF
jgi:glycosyltransferase involved in cell wall biosynthesis